MSVYPRNLSNFLNRLSGYNKNNVKMNVLGNLDAKQTDTVQVDLPTNSIVDLSSLAWAFRLEYKASGQAHNVDLPINAESIISRLAVEVNGQTLVNISNYNVLFHALLYTTATEDYQRQRKTAQGNTMRGIANGTSERLQNVATHRDHVIDTWLGFLGSAKPHFIDTSLLGNVRITITLASGEIIGGDNAANARGFALTDQKFSIDVVSISDGIYDAMVDQMLASGAPIEIPFKNYFTFSQNNPSMIQITPFHVASQSVDRLWGIARARDAHGIGTAGYSEATAQRIGTAPAHNLIAHNPPFFNLETCNGSDFQFQINNTMYPQWSSDMAQDWWQKTKLAVGDQGNMLAGSYPQAISQYTKNFFVFAVSLEHRTDGDERFVSGIDTRGAAASCFFSSKQHPGTDWNTGLAGNPGLPLNRNAQAVANQTTVFAECTSLLRVMANKVIEVVQ